MDRLFTSEALLRLRNRMPIEGADPDKGSAGVDRSGPRAGSGVGIAEAVAGDVIFIFLTSIK